MADTLSSQELDEIAGVLNESASETMAICLERDFKELYLPVFSGEVVNDRAVNAWIYLAGGPLKRVRVVDDATGAELFQVPSWFSTDHMSIVPPKDTKVPSFGEVVAQAMMCVHHSPMKATEAFQEATLKHVVANINKASENKVHGEWESIFARYGITAETILNNFKTRIAEKNGTTAQVATAADASKISSSETLLEDGFVAEE